MNTMKKRHEQKVKAVATVIAHTPTMDNAVTPDDVAAVIAKRKGIQMSGMTAYLILVDMVKAGDAFRKKIGHTWFYAREDRLRYQRRTPA